MTNALRPISAIVISCSRGWQPAHQGVIPGQVGHPFLIIRKLADRGRNAWVRTVMSDQSLAVTGGYREGSFRVGRQLQVIGLLLVIGAVTV